MDAQSLRRGSSSSSTLGELSDFWRQIAFCEVFVINSSRFLCVTFVATMRFFRNGNLTYQDFCLQFIIIIAAAAPFSFPGCKDKNALRWLSLFRLAIATTIHHKDICCGVKVKPRPSNKDQCDELQSRSQAQTVKPTFRNLARHSRENMGKLKGRHSHKDDEILT